MSQKDNIFSQRRKEHGYSVRGVAIKAEVSRRVAIKIDCGELLEVKLGDIIKVANCLEIDLLAVIEGMTIVV